VLAQIVLPKGIYGIAVLCSVLLQMWLTVGGKDTIYVHAGTYVKNVNVWKRVTLIGDGADAVTVRAMDFNSHNEIDK